MWTKYAWALGLIMARLCYPHLHQCPMQELWMGQSSPCLQYHTWLPLPCLPAPAELSREGSVWLAVIWGCLWGVGMSWMYSKRKGSKLIYPFQSVYLSLPYWSLLGAFPSCNGASHVCPALLQPRGTAAQISSATKLQAQILPSSHECFCSVHCISGWGSAAVPCACSPGRHKEQITSNPGLVWLWLRAACTTHRPSLSVLHTNCVIGWWSHPSEKHKHSDFCIGNKLLLTKYPTAAFHKVFNTLLYEIHSVRTCTSKDRQSSAQFLNCVPNWPVILQTANINT